MADRKFENLPKGGIFTFSDSETGEVITFENMKKEYNLAMEVPKSVLTIYTDENYVVKLMNYLKRRRNI